MITNDYKSFKAVQILSELSTKEFNKLLGVSNSTRYAWRERTRILYVYMLLGTVISKNKELVQRAVHEPRLNNLSDVLEYKKDMSNSFFQDMLMVKEHVYYSWLRRNAMKQCYLNLINCIAYDYDLVKETVLEIGEIEGYEFSSEELFEVPVTEI